MKRIILGFILILAFCAAVFGQESKVACPKISLVSPSETLKPDESAKFIVKVDEAEKFNIGYVWTVSIGAIVKGQGTSEIEFSSIGLQSTGVNVSVKINGLPENCPNEVAELIGIAERIIYEPIDSFGKVEFNNDYRQRLDNLFAHLMTSPDFEGVILLAFDKKDDRNYKISLLNKINKHINFRKLSLSRVTFLISEDDSERTIFWTERPDSGFTAEYEKDGYKVIKAEELKGQIKKLFRKK